MTTPRYAERGSRRTESFNRLAPQRGKVCNSERLTRKIDSRQKYSAIVFFETDYGINWLDCEWLWIYLVRIVKPCEAKWKVLLVRGSSASTIHLLDILKSFSIITQISKWLSILFWHRSARPCSATAWLTDAWNLEWACFFFFWNYSLGMSRHDVVDVHLLSAEHFLELFNCGSDFGDTAYELVHISPRPRFRLLIADVTQERSLARQHLEMEQRLLEAKIQGFSFQMKGKWWVRKWANRKGKSIIRLEIISAVEDRSGRTLVQHSLEMKTTPPVPVSLHETSLAHSWINQLFNYF